MQVPLPDATIKRSRHKRRRHRSRRWLWASLGTLAAAGAAVLVFLWWSGAGDHAPLGYIDDYQKFREEYFLYAGKPSQDPAIREQFENAARLVRAKDYAGALAVLEPVSRQIPVPMLFNNMGVLYERVHDRARAISAFREALVLDSGYVPVRENLKLLKGLAPGAVDPVTHEVEPNDNLGIANLVPVGQPVEAAITGTTDADYFRFTAPRPPRDVLEIRIENRSHTLAPGLAAYDSDRRFAGWGKKTREAGETLLEYLSPAPNSVMYLHMWGQKGSEGAYVLLVRPTHAFDASEPNDDIFHATHLEMGQPVEANIMDDQDTDYYTFSRKGDGPVEVVIENRSNSLIPATSAFGTDRRFIGFGPEAHKPGAGLRHPLTVEDSRAYYIQVYSQANTSGAYRITLR